MLIRVLLGLAIGATAGGLLGYLGKCTSGMCPLTATPLRGLLIGGLLGLTIGFGTSRAVTGPTRDDSYAALPEFTSAEDFDEQVLEADKPVMVDFHQPGCPPCEQLQPIFGGLARDHAETANFAKVNIQRVPGLVRRYQIAGTPTVILFQDGEIVDRWVGLNSRSTYENALEALAATSAETDAPTKGDDDDEDSNDEGQSA